MFFVVFIVTVIVIITLIVIVAPIAVIIIAILVVVVVIIIATVVIVSITSVVPTPITMAVVSLIGRVMVVRRRGRLGQRRRRVTIGVLLRLWLGRRSVVGGRILRRGLNSGLLRGQFRRREGLRGRHIVAGRA